MDHRTIWILVEICRPWKSLALWIDTTLTHGIPNAQAAQAAQGHFGDHQLHLHPMFVEDMTRAAVNWKVLGRHRSHSTGGMAWSMRPKL